MENGIDNVHISGFEPLPEPREVRSELPQTQATAAVVRAGRQQVRDSIAGSDTRMLVVVGPCSIHDPDAALEYATRLALLRDRVADRLLVLMRVYFEKPRTTLGWKGLINDPSLDGAHDIHRGLRRARRILLRINELGLPCATEFLDPVVPQFTADLVSWAAIGARTTESQPHREMASGLSMPVGFKNATDGGLQVALDAMVSARHAHHFLGIGQEGRVCAVRTTGNPDVHLVLRGGNAGTNFERADLAYTQVKLEDIGVGGRRILVDCSHGNSNKDFRRQPAVFRSVLSQLTTGQRGILGAMLESNLAAGSQKLIPNTALTYGQSITDACIDWETTEELLLTAHEALERQS
ncbi:MAG: 3-deoxy-7-phosphoheptulonate synthase [Polyangiaceae bacterium]|jgi:3-deoxy-7-phosphoheptulonate synthase|nr:3-deoxy-7-phosphoheptulonate synthase [Polyangiaceae bacterium]